MGGVLTPPNPPPLGTPLQFIRLTYIYRATYWVWGYWVPSSLPQKCISVVFAVGQKHLKDMRAAVERERKQRQRDEKQRQRLARHKQTATTTITTTTTASSQPSSSLSVGSGSGYWCNVTRITNVKIYAISQCDSDMCSCRFITSSTRSFEEFICVLIVMIYSSVLRSQIFSYWLIEYFCICRIICKYVTDAPRFTR